MIDVSASETRTFLFSSDYFFFLFLSASSSPPPPAVNAPGDGATDFFLSVDEEDTRHVQSGQVPVSDGPGQSTHRNRETSHHDYGACFCLWCLQHSSPASRAVRERVSLWLHFSTWLSLSLSLSVSAVAHFSHVVR